MKYAILFASAAALALSACQSEEPAADAADAPAADAGEAAAPAAAAPAGATGADAAFTAGQPPSKEFMAGTWGEGEECELPINFKADGTITDGPFANWTIEGDYLVMSDPDLDGGPRIKVAVVDQDTMESQLDGEGETKILKRCG